METKLTARSKASEVFNPFDDDPSLINVAEDDLLDLSKEEKFRVSPQGLVRRPDESLQEWKLRMKADLEIYYNSKSKLRKLREQHLEEAPKRQNLADKLFIAQWKEREELEKFLAAQQKAFDAFDRKWRAAFIRVDMFCVAEGEKTFKTKQLLFDKEYGKEMRSREQFAKIQNRRIQQEKAKQAQEQTERYRKQLADQAAAQNKDFKSDVAKMRSRLINEQDEERKRQRERELHYQQKMNKSRDRTLQQFGLIDMGDG